MAAPTVATTPATRPASTRKPARWILPAPDPAATARLIGELSLHPAVAAILVKRGYTEPESARHFLSPAVADLIPPERLHGMAAAVARLRRAIAGGEKILLYGDYDVDGTMSLVLLTKAIEICGGQCAFHVPHRLKEGYGMRPEVIDRAAAAGVTLIVSVDTGIRANDVVRHAAGLGIDVIVTDHHLPETEIPPAVAVLNPNQPGCDYPNKNLCGAGVTLKLVEALLAAMDLPPERQRKLNDSFLKLAAIATVADVVPLTGENRVLVRHGLAGIERTPNPGLRALLSVAGLEGRTPTARQVGFQIGPRINAAGRLASARDVVELLLNADAARARAIAEQLDRLNRERQTIEMEMVQAILDQVAAAPVTDDQAALVFAGEGWHKGVVGIVASRVVNRFNRPAFVLGLDPETGLAQGSGRSVPLFHLLDSLESMPELFTKFGGHRQAAGLTMPLQHVDEFRQRFSAYAAARLSPEDFRPQVEVDAELSLDDLGPALFEQIEQLAPFGSENDAPVFLVRGCEIPAAPQIKKEQHVFFHVRQGRRVHQVKAWRFAERAPEIFAGARLDIAFTIEQDRYDGWSLTLDDLRPAE